MLLGCSKMNRCKKFHAADMLIPLSICIHTHSLVSLALEFRNWCLRNKVFFSPLVYKTICGKHSVFQLEQSGVI